jgi:hypothetical protein
VEKLDKELAGKAVFPCEQQQVVSLNLTEHDQDGGRPGETKVASIF